MDLYHAREHLHDLGKLLAFMLGDHHKDWLAERSAEPGAGDIGAIAAAARAFPLTGTKAAERDKALAYFQTNAPRMRYQHFRALGLFVGSGAVEAGCKAVIGQRLKLSGMHWTCPAPPASSPCAASRPAAAGKKSGSSPAVRHQPPEPVWRRPHNQTTTARSGYRPVTYIHVPHPSVRVRCRNVGAV